MMTSEARPHRRSLWALDWLNIFGADVRTGVGPYLAIYLQARRHWSPSTQLLDGVGSGIFGVLSVLVVADLTRGTGRFNITNGAISTATGIGAALSNAVSGVIVQYAGYDGAFLALAGIAAVAALLFGLAMPETQGDKTMVGKTVPETGAGQSVAGWDAP